ncbi:MAG: hypothetical protein GX230_08040 [Lentisphaerae bacterium]|nr:hypothetical protein [Lentisphaerota bacterium]
MAAVVSKEFKAVVVTHSHWDREWYQSLEEYRFRLIELVDRLLAILNDEPEYHSFWLDGHTAPLADYLLIRPERREELEQRLREGKIKIGPWYVLADEFLVSGEACVRNLLTGVRQMRQYGQNSAIGYAPDTFGHIDQLPQILQGFGLDNAFFWRGYSLEQIDGAETLWRGRDGSEVKVVCLVGGYSNSRGITVDLDNTADRIDVMLGRLQHYCASGTLLLMNGIDHALPTPQIAEVIRRVEERFPEVTAKHGSLEDYLEAVAVTHSGSKPLTGELFQVAGLDGCLSNRPQQKRLNRHLEESLAVYAEPLALQADGLGEVPLLPFVARAWELLLKCHPHDTICGCHTDTVARDMEMRLHRGLQITDEVEQRAITALLGLRARAGALGLPCKVAVYNPLPWSRSERVSLDLPLPLNVGEIRLRDNRGRVVQSRIVAMRNGYYSEFFEYKIPTREACLVARLECYVEDLPPSGVILLEVDDAPQVQVDAMETGDGDGSAVAGLASLGSRLEMLENGQLRVKVYADGSFDLFDKRSGVTLEGLNKLRIEADHGDLYRFAPALEDEISGTESGFLTRISDTALCQAVEVNCAITLRGERVPLKIAISLTAEKGQVEIEVAFDNRFNDFRLQAAMPLATATGVGLAHTPFSLSPRQPIAPREAPRYVRGERFRVNAVSQPMHSLALFEIADGEGLALYNRGLYEYTWEHCQQPRLTLMRGVGKIMTELAEHDASGGQSHGAQQFAYAVGVMPYGEPHMALAAAQEYAMQPRVLPLFAEPQRQPESGVEFRNRCWVYSGMKRAESGSGDILRLWNASEREESGEVILPSYYSGATLVRLDETPLQSLEIRDGRVCFSVKPYGIATLLLRRGAAVRCNNQ